VLVPLVEAGKLANYLQIGLHNDRIADLYDQSRSRLITLMLASLAAVAALSVILQMQLSRRAASIAAVLEKTSAPKRMITPADEFTRVLHSASRVKGALEEARRESQRCGLQVGVFARILQVGVVVVGPDF
jgi:hypothetical protein